MKFKISKEFRIGVFVILAIGLLVVGFQYLMGIDLSKKNRTYKVFYRDARGLEPSNPVIFRGIQVGLVKDVDLVKFKVKDTTWRRDPETGARQIEKIAMVEKDCVQVTIQIDHDVFRMRDSTEAKLGSDGFLGGMKIELKYLDDKYPYARWGDTLVANVERSIQEEINLQVAPLKKKAEDLISQVDSVIQIVAGFWNSNLSGNVDESMQSIKRAIFQFEKTAVRIDTLVASERHRLSRILRNVESISQNLMDNNQNITDAMDNIATFSENLKKVDLEVTIQRAEDALGKFNLIVDQINSQEGNLGKLIYDDSLYRALIETNSYLQLLVEDIRYYPNRYIHFSIFGSREKTPKLNSKEEKLLKELLDIKKDGELRRFTQPEIDSLIKKVWGP